uniref:Cl2727_2b n=1 Tax=Arundo donax TaxID=35708 RepID=A0A0A9EE87_ARUDO
MLFFLSIIRRSSSAVNFTILTSCENHTTNVYVCSLGCASRSERRDVEWRRRRERSTKP